MKNIKQRINAADVTLAELSIQLKEARAIKESLSDELESMSNDDKSKVLLDALSVWLDGEIPEDVFYMRRYENAYNLAKQEVRDILTKISQNKE